MYQSILPAYGLNEDIAIVEAFGSGLINSTWKVTASAKTFILQRVNDQVFKEPSDIAHNLRLIACYLREHHSEYTFVGPLPSVSGGELVHGGDGGFYRMFPFIDGSHSIDVVQTPEQAFEAATQFGRFTRLLSGLDIQQLKTTIPRFHDLRLRFEQFEEALRDGHPGRLAETRELIETVKRYADIVAEFDRIRQNPEFRLRVTHHDTKISNVLFDAADRGLCVVDLDTVMPGYFISDVGDMMRTYLSPVSEEEKDFDKIVVREEFYRAIVEGYYREMKDELTPTEKGSFFYAGKFMIYMQALRFLTDHLLGDRYYGARYPGHNLLRAQNQMVLLQRLVEKEALLAPLSG